jgi:hypothetical protein
VAALVYCPAAGNIQMENDAERWSLLALDVTSNNNKTKLEAQAKLETRLICI